LGENADNLSLRICVKKGDGKMECPNCQFDNREEAVFCLECGAELEIKCPGCEKSLPSRTKFCDTCGRDLSQPQKAKVQAPEPAPGKKAPPPKPIESERKHVTALF
jgi:predicted amidophosphoribosyltransferase